MQIRLQFDFFLTMCEQIANAVHVIYILMSATLKCARCYQDDLISLFIPIAGKIKHSFTFVHIFVIQNSTDSFFFFFVFFQFKNKDNFSKEFSAYSAEMNILPINGIL